MALDPATYEGLSAYHIQSIVMSPPLWDDHAVSSPKLRWKEIKFAKKNAIQIPERRGVYAFLIKNKQKTARWPLHGYIMYIGVAGKPGTAGNLRKRFGDYFSKTQLEGRPRIKRLVTTWKDVLYFDFASVGKATDLLKLET